MAHAGEWTSAEAVREAIEDLGVQRVGHGVRVVDDPRVAALARERGVVFEVCITSNLQSGVIEQVADHPLRAMTDPAAPDDPQHRRPGRLGHHAQRRICDGG